MGAADRLDAGHRQAEMPDLAGLYEPLHRARHVLHWHVRIDPVLIEEIDHIGTQALQSLVRHLTDALGPAVGGLSRVAVAEPEFGRDHESAAYRFPTLRRPLPR